MGRLAKVVGRGPTRTHPDRCALFPHSCPGSPSALTSCLPALAPHTSHAGVGKSGSKANVKGGHRPAPQSQQPRTLAPSPTSNGSLGRMSARWLLQRAPPWSPNSGSQLLQELPSFPVLPQPFVHMKYTHNIADLIS